MNMLTLSKAQIQCMGGSSGTPVAYFICLFIYLLYTAHSQVPTIVKSLYSVIEKFNIILHFLLEM